MKKKLVVALMAMMLAGTTFATSTTAQAAGLTQATDPNEIDYGWINPEEVAVLEGMFDYEYYKTQNPELVEVLGDDYSKLFEHFYKCGIFEGRTCNANFDPAAYSSAYSDLKDVFGANIVGYYVHYALVGSNENRDLTTVEACANAGITVDSLVDASVKITPQTYFVANALGLNYDYYAVQRALNSATSSGSKTSVISGPGGSVVVTPMGNESAMEKCKNLTNVCTITTDTCFNFYVYSYNDGNTSGYRFSIRGNEYTYESDEYFTGGNGCIKVYMGDSVFGAGEMGVYVRDLVEVFKSFGSFTSDAEEIETEALYDSSFEREQAPNLNGSITYIDSEGTASTVYNVGIDITDMSEDGFVLETGIYNEDNQFAVYHKYAVKFDNQHSSSSNNNMTGAATSTNSTTTSQDTTSTNSTTTSQDTTSTNSTTTSQDTTSTNSTTTSQDTTSTNSTTTSQDTTSADGTTTSQDTTNTDNTSSNDGDNTSNND